jgi:hypothetical protein
VIGADGYERTWRRLIDDERVRGMVAPLDDEVAERHEGLVVCTCRR